MLKDQPDDQVPSSPEFALGYYDGSQQAKVWLYTTEDLAATYSRYPKGGAINLWCDGNYDLGDGGSQQRKKGADAAAEHSLHRKAKEDDIERIFKNLREKQSGKFEPPKLHLWSRMIAAGIHDDYEKPPDIPALGHARRQCQIASVVRVEALQQDNCSKCYTRTYINWDFTWKMYRTANEEF